VVVRDVEVADCGEERTQNRIRVVPIQHVGEPDVGDHPLGGEESAAGGLREKSDARCVEVYARDVDQRVSYQESLIHWECEISSHQWGQRCLEGVELVVENGKLGGVLEVGGSLLRMIERSNRRAALVRSIKGVWALCAFNPSTDFVIDEMLGNAGGEFFVGHRLFLGLHAGAEWRAATTSQILFNARTADNALSRSVNSTASVGFVG